MSITQNCHFPKKNKNKYWNNSVSTISILTQSTWETCHYVRLKDRVGMIGLERPLLRLQFLGSNPHPSLQKPLLQPDVICLSVRPSAPLTSHILYVYEKSFYCYNTSCFHALMRKIDQQSLKIFDSCNVCVKRNEVLDRVNNQNASERPGIVEGITISQKYYFLPAISSVSSSEGFFFRGQTAICYNDLDINLNQISVKRAYPADFPLSS